ncbi:hypothetical protein F8S13_22150 [Chloroflexia bacterium SDU3-3]|nr:hypothetical protein F8S13_22150 [Chloroflexia bacterium SDU3-3]
MRRKERAMSLAVMMRVWAAPTVRGSQKLLLLALADYANGAGVCWPGLAALAQRIGEEERHCRRLLRALEGQGLIARAVGGGRARPTLYAVLAGLDHAAQHQLRRRLAEGGADLTQGPGAPSALLENPDLEDRVLAAHGPRNPVPSVRVSAPRHGQNPGVEVRVSGGADGRNPDIRAPKGGHVGTERGTSGDAGEAASAAPPCAETVFFAQDNRQRTVREPDHTEGGGHDHAAHARTPPPAPHPCGDGHDDHHPPAADPSAPLRPAPRFGTKNRFPRSFRASWAENMHEEERITVQTPLGQAQEPAPRPDDADISAPVGRPDAARPWASRPPLMSGGHNEEMPVTADLPRAGNPTPRPAAARPWASRPPWGAAGQNNDARPAGPHAAQAAPNERIQPAVEATGPQDAHAAPPSAHRASPAAVAQAAPADHLPSGLIAQGAISTQARPAAAAQAASAEQPPSGLSTPAQGALSTRPAVAAQAAPRDEAGAAPPERQRSAAVAQFYAVFPQARLSAAQEDEITAGVADRHLGLWTRVVREWRDQRYNPHSTTKILHLFSKEERREAAERAREAGRDHGGGPAASGGRTGDPSTWPLGERERRTLERIRAELAVRGV